MKKISFTCLLFLCFSCNPNNDPGEVNHHNDQRKYAIPAINYVVSKVYPHDTASFTEGFLVHEGKLFESTGSPDYLPQTKSVFGPVDLNTGVIDPKVELDRDKYFGEGIAILNGKIFQLTYLTRKGFVYDADTYKKINEFTFPSKEGWGMTTDGSSLIMSDGTNQLTYLDPITFRTRKTLPVTDENGAVSKLNELELINGSIYANVYTTSIIVKIDPNSGHITGKLDLSSIVSDVRAKYPGSLEMNGIAYDSTAGKVFVTGKLWPGIYEISFDH